MNIKLLCSKRGLTCFAFNITYYFSQIFQVRAFDLDTLLCWFFFFFFFALKQQVKPRQMAPTAQKACKIHPEIGTNQYYSESQTHSYLSIKLQVSQP